MKNIIKSVVLVICVIAIVFCGSNIYGQYTSMHESKQGLTDYTTLVNASSIQSPVSYQEHYDNNPDYRGWIWFESNLIDLPVMQSSDNSFYLNHDENKGFDFEGEPFIDAANSLDDQNVSIYGHSIFNAPEMENDRFSPLRKLLDQQTYDQNNHFYIAWQDDIRKYQIFAVCIVDTANDNWTYTKNIFQTDTDFYKFVHEAKKRSVVSADVDIKATDRLITLQTCKELDSTERIVVIAKEN